MDRIEEQQRQEERLEVIRKELGYDIKEQEIRQLSTWLMDVGYEREIADQAAREVIDANLSALDEIDIQKEGAKTALRIKQASSQSPTTSSRKARKQLEPTEPDDLRLIVSQGKNRKMPAYEALQKAQFIKHTKEFYV